MSQESAAQSRQRIEYLDLFRGIGILLMITGHVEFGSSFAYCFRFFFHAFHMPMFFWIAGYLFQPKSREELPFSSFAARKAKTLLLPYAVFGLAHYLVTIVTGIAKGRPFSLYPLIRLLTVNTDDLPICGAIWFLTALFFTYLIVYLIENTVFNGVVKGILVVVISLIGNYASSIFPFELPYALGPAFVGVGLFYLGYHFKRNIHRMPYSFLENMSWLPTILLAVIVTFLIFANGFIDMRPGEYAFVPLFWINSVLAILVVKSFSRLLYPLIHRTFPCRLLMRLGRNAIVYLCLNQFVIAFASKLCSLFVLPNAVTGMLVLIISLAVLSLADRIFMETPLKKLLGK